MFAYIGGTVLATAVVTNIATKVVTGAPSVIINTLSRVGYSQSTAKASYGEYYKRMVSEGPLYETILNILARNAEKSYSTTQDPRDKNRWISADILCFKNTTTFYDYSSFGFARARFYYDYRSGQTVIICKKKSEIEDFCSRLEDPGFNPESLTFVGVG